MSKRKARVAVIGHFAFGKECFDGQTVKTKIVTNELCRQLGNDEVLKLDTAGGKSTLLKCIYRVLKPDTGVIMLDGKPLNEYKVKDSAKALAVVSQHNYYNFEFSVQEIVMMGRAPHKKTMERDNAEDYKIVEECLEKVGMLPYRHRVFSSLSGGEQQRIILARALAQKTDCLILDEPTNHLDIKYQLQLLDIVKSLGITVIGALHDLNIAAAYCDRIYAMKNGRLVACGTPEEVITEDFIHMLYEVDATVK